MGWCVSIGLAIYCSEHCRQGITSREVSDAEKLFLALTDTIHSLHAYPYGDRWDMRKLQKFAVNLPAERPLFPHLQDLGLPLVSYEIPL